jgi:hypothetical protein
MEHQASESIRSPTAEPESPVDMMLSEQSGAFEMDDIPMDMATPISSPVRDTIQSSTVSCPESQETWTPVKRETTPARPSTPTPEPPTPPLPSSVQPLPTTYSSPPPYCADTELTSTAPHRNTPEPVATRQPSAEPERVVVPQVPFKSPDLPTDQPAGATSKPTSVQPQSIQPPKRTHNNPNGVFARDQVMPWTFHVLNAENHRLEVVNIEVCVLLIVLNGF